MKKRKLIALGLAAALALALTACGAKLTGVGLPQEELKLTVGGTAALEPVFTWDGEAPAEDPAVTYTSADEAVASCLYTQIPESRINTELFNHHQKTEYPYNHTENAF